MYGDDVNQTFISQVSNHYVILEINIMLYVNYINKKQTTTTNPECTGN